MRYNPPLRANEMDKPPTEAETRITDEGQVIRPAHDPITRDQGVAIIILLLILVVLALWHTFKDWL